MTPTSSLSELHRRGTLDEVPRLWKADDPPPPVPRLQCDARAPQVAPRCQAAPRTALPLRSFGSGFPRLRGPRSQSRDTLRHPPRGRHCHAHHHCHCHCCCRRLSHPRGRAPAVGLAPTSPKPPIISPHPSLIITPTPTPRPLPHSTLGRRLYTRTRPGSPSKKVVQCCDSHKDVHLCICVVDPRVPLSPFQELSTPISSRYPPHIFCPIVTISGNTQVGSGLHTQRHSRPWALGVSVGDCCFVFLKQKKEGPGGLTQ